MKKPRVLLHLAALAMGLCLLAGCAAQPAAPAQATCMIVKAIPRIAQTLNAGPSSWNAIGIESLPIVYLPDTVAMGTAPYAGLLSPDVGNLPQVARAIHRRSPIRAAIVLIDLRLAS